MKYSVGMKSACVKSYQQETCGVMNCDAMGM